MTLPTLDDLLTEALRHAKEARIQKAPPGLRKLHEPIFNAHQAYLNEENWKPGGLVGIAHHAADGSVTYLGVFRQFSYFRGPASKLIPTTGLVSECDDFLHVTGDHWLGPVASLQPIDDHIEVLKARFYELLCDLGV